MYHTQTYEILLQDTLSGEKIRIGPEDNNPLRLLENGLSGFGATELFVETEPYADGTGAYPVKRQFGERYMAITAELNPTPDIPDTDSLRRRICAILNPLRTLEMQITLGGVTRRIDVIPCGRPVFRQATFFTPVEVTLPFVAPSPMYRGESEKRIDFWNALPLLTFPMNFMKGAGLVSGFYRTTDKAKVVNMGDGECGFVATLKAAGGAVVNPAIVSGERYIRLLVTLQDGDTASVDTRPRQKNVWVNGERRFIFHRESEFFLLDVGENTIQVTADSGVDNLSVSLVYTPLYYGI